MTRMVPLGHVQLTSMTTATGLTIPAGATMAVLSAEAQTVRFRDDGVAPTAAIGVPLLVTSPPLEYRGTISSLKFIAATTGAILNVAFYRDAG